MWARFLNTLEGVKTLGFRSGDHHKYGSRDRLYRSIFPSDEMTREFLKAQGLRLIGSFVPDENATYDEIIEINLSES